MAMARTPRDSAVEMTEMVFPQHTNPLGNVFGGVVLSWIDVAAGIAAMRHCGQVVVTASLDAMNFIAPIKLGWVVNIHAAVNYVGRSSCEVGVKIYAESPIEGKKYHTASAYVTMVALDQHGKKMAMPPLIPETADEKRRHQAAQQRRAVRLALSKKNGA